MTASAQAISIEGNMGKSVSLRIPGCKAVHKTVTRVAPRASTFLGVGFVLLGALGIGIAAWQFARFLKTLPASDRPPGYWTTLGLWYSSVVAVLGLLLAAYLVWGSK
jgi:hypothetical protein